MDSPTLKTAGAPSATPATGSTGREGAQGSARFDHGQDELTSRDTGGSCRSTRSRAGAVYAIFVRLKHSTFTPTGKVSPYLNLR